LVATANCPPQSMRGANLESPVEDRMMRCRWCMEPHSRPP
jgi:hypothetical protein